VNTKTSLLTVLALNTALFTGCTVTTGSSSRAIRVADEQCASSESKTRQLQQELKLAEKRADLEKQKRELAEERLKKLQEKRAKPDVPEKESDHGS
jgi:outer membrane biogenesis lipoprotein LolB